MSNAPWLPRRLIPHLPFFYGWVILACVCCAGLARQGGAVATLSVFIAPMTQEFGWSRTAMSGAVSLGGVLAAILAPFIGRLLDKEGPRRILCIAIPLTGFADIALSQVSSLWMFYLLFVVARVNFAVPFDLGIYGAVSNWFVKRRPFAMSLATTGLTTGLIILPLLAQLAADRAGDWRAGWIAIGVTVLVVGFVPCLLFLVRRPEDVGLVPDRQIASGSHHPAIVEPSFTRHEALRTPAFWLLSLFTLLAYPVQAGVSLHQAPFLIERGLSPTIAAAVVSFFSIGSGVASLVFGLIPRRIAIRHRLALVGFLLGAGSAALLAVRSAELAFPAAALFGLGVGGLLSMLPLAWADYFGRSSFGAIRGIALTVQVLSQAAGPMISGVLRDFTGGYETSLTVFWALSWLSLVAALFARPPSWTAGDARGQRDC
ncbi:MAG: MFS transporter [Acetobacteraceae bacterium]